MHILVALVCVFVGALSSCSPAGGDSGQTRALAGAPQPLVSTIDHIYASSPQARELFFFFRDSLGLTQAWSYQEWEGFASGGVSLGNVVLEFVREPADAPTAFTGIAFEPVLGTKEMLLELDRRGIRHSDASVYESRAANGQPNGWITTGLSDFPSANVFFCDYQDRAAIAANRRWASDSLAARGGGALGVWSLASVALGVRDLAAQREVWSQLTDSTSQVIGDRFAFGPGPNVQLVAAEAESVQQLTLFVHSLERARAYLAEHRILGEVTGTSVMIAPAAVGGLRVLLVGR